MKFTLRLLILCCLAQTSFAQSVTNGNFSAGSIGWGCNPEINTESVYGGSSVTNSVAEVDAEAQLCQTVSGFTPGAVYRLRFSASRRTTCGPTLQTINVSISGNALSATVSRNGTAFSLVQESFQFTATSASHTLSFTNGTPGTCNILVDNVQIQLVSGLPVELTRYFAEASGKKVDLGWTTATELRNDFFTVERSTDGKNWDVAGTIDGAGTTTEENNYAFTDENPLNGVSYYRLSQTDLDGTHKELEIRSVELLLGEEMTAYPNPAVDVLTVYGVDTDAAITVYDASGREMPFSLTSPKKGTAVLDVSALPAGSYLVRTASGFLRFLKA